MSRRKVCGVYDVVVEVPQHRNAEVVQDWLYEHLRAHAIGRPDNMPVRVFLHGPHWPRRWTLPAGVVVGYEHRTDAPKTHRLRFLDLDLWPPRVECVRCGARGIWLRETVGQEVITDPRNLPRMRQHPTLPIKVPHVQDLNLAARWWAPASEVRWEAAA